jgi:periplasmic divalent cation tolerance protein
MNMQMDEAPEGLILLYSTWPDEAAAEAAARALLEERLIACANIMPAGRSVFRWEGKVTAEAETVALFKTTRARAGDARTRLVDLHPYDEPCVLALPVDTAASAAGFLAWVARETA